MVQSTLIAGVTVVALFLQMIYRPYMPFKKQTSFAAYYGAIVDEMAAEVRAARRRSEQWRQRPSPTCPLPVRVLPQDHDPEADGLDPQSGGAAGTASSVQPTQTTGARGAPMRAPKVAIVPHRTDSARAIVAAGATSNAAAMNQIDIRKLVRDIHLEVRATRCVVLAAAIRSRPRAHERRSLAPPLRSHRRPRRRAAAAAGSACAASLRHSRRRS